MHIEKKKFFKVLSKVSTERNEAYAKMELFRSDLQQLNNLIQVDDFTSPSSNRIDLIINELEKFDVTKAEIDWIIANLSFIKEDLSRLQAKNKLNEKIIMHKNSELLLIQNKLKRPQKASNRSSPSYSKISTSNCSPVHSLDAFVFTGCSPRYYEKEKALAEGKRLNTEVKLGKYSDEEYLRVVAELSNFKLKFALLKEFLITRDNEERMIISKIKKGDKQAIEEALEILTEMLNETNEMLIE